MLPQEIIRKKRLGLDLSNTEIEEFFHGFLDGQVSDYQMSAMLMVILMRGMSRQEVTKLTHVMKESGKILDWGGDRNLVVDKHSTGGVGDKTSMIILPLCVLEGLRVPMIAGRGLGHTGGTLDKLESITGMNVFLTGDEASQFMRKNGGVFMGQTREIAPLDKRLYAMRDVTDTVESIPLITASILSKKLAEGIGCLIMDIKYGSGAFMEGRDDALALAESISAVGRASGVNIKCALTDMGSPLGTSAGNSLEIIECVDILKGGGPESSLELSVQLAAELILLARPHESRVDLIKRLHNHLQSGRAFEVFCKVIGAQGGDTKLLEDTSRLPQSAVRVEVPSAQGGYVSSCNVRELGLTIVELGGGRRRSSDCIKPAVGLSGMKRVGERIQKGEPLAIIHAESTDSAQSVVNRIQSAYKVSDKAESEPLIWRII